MRNSIIAKQKKLKGRRVEKAKTTDVMMLPYLAEDVNIIRLWHTNQANFFIIYIICRKIATVLVADEILHLVIQVQAF